MKLTLILKRITITKSFCWSRFFCCELSLRLNFLLAAAAWRTRCLLSRDAAINFNRWTADWPVHFRRIILVVWDRRLRTDCRVVHGRYVSVGRTEVTAVVSSFWDIRVSENVRWCHLNTLTRSTLTTGVHCDVHGCYISVGEPQVTAVVPLFWDVRVSENVR